MTVRPIIFSAPMVRALLEGRKTQTRRLAWRDGTAFVGAGPARPGHKVEYVNLGSTPIPLSRAPSLWQRVKPGDLLWVRETLQRYERLPPTAQYTATLEGVAADARGMSSHPNHAALWTWKVGKLPSIHMPRWASRLTLEVTGVKIERLQDISQDDASEEGVRCDMSQWSFRDHYAALWKRLHGDASWHANPEVVALSFTVRRQNVDDFLRQREAA